VFLRYPKQVQRPLHVFALCGAVLMCNTASAQETPPQAPTFQSAVTLVTSDVIVRDRRGQFQASLTKDDFDVYEDGVKQEIA
jgi:hypothetical protein